MNTCAICEAKFTEWSEYASHKLSARCFKKILPVRNPNRTKQQTVDIMENGPLKRGIIQ